ncbi:MAG: helix-turn-helix domain-containing protein [Neptuniibacter sp.]
MSKTKARSSTQKSDWHREDIKAAIRKKSEMSVAAFAKQSGYKNPATFYNVFKMPYPKIERIIAELLEVEPYVIWPSRYANRSTKNSEFIGIATTRVA